VVLYLDICCLKRPFDDQAQPRIRLESEAVLGPAIKVRVGELIAIAREVL
jgi:hypothetical protein